MCIDAAIYAASDEGGTTTLVKFVDEPFSISLCAPLCYLLAGFASDVLWRYFFFSLTFIESNRPLTLRNFSAIIYAAHGHFNLIIIHVITTNNLFFS